MKLNFSFVSQPALDVKKFKEDLSLACRDRMIRNRHLRPLLRLLWYGLVEDARGYLAAIPTDDLKDTAPIVRLQSYLDRNEGSIPSSALRKASWAYATQAARSRAPTTRSPPAGRSAMA